MPSELNELRLHLSALRLVNDLLELAPVSEDAERGDAKLVLMELGDRYGWETVHGWLVNLAATQGIRL